MVFKLAFAMIAFLLAGSAHATSTTFNIVGGFSGGQLGDVTLDVIVTGDFSADIEDMAVDSAILSSSVLSPFTEADVGGLAFSYIADGETLLLGGLTFGVTSIGFGTTDFLYGVTGLISMPTPFTMNDTLAGEPGAGSPVASQEVIVRDITAAVPLPASVFLLLGGLGLLVSGTRRKA